MDFGKSSLSLRFSENFTVHFRTRIMSAQKGGFTEARNSKSKKHWEQEVLRWSSRGSTKIRLQALPKDRPDFLPFFSSSNETLL
jgi:hypothetical protein